MITVVCFCGRSYSFAGDTGACPQCGEYVTTTRERIKTAHDTRAELGAETTVASSTATSVTIDDLRQRNEASTKPEEILKLSQSKQRV